MTDVEINLRAVVQWTFPILQHEVIDGSTLGVVIDLGWHVLSRVTLHLQGIVTPELGVGGQLAAAETSAAAVRWWFERLAGRPVAWSVELVDGFACVGDVLDTGRPGGVDGRLSAWMLREGYAIQAAAGETEHAWTSSELDRIEALRAFM